LKAGSLRPDKSGIPVNPQPLHGPSLQPAAILL
jgi:hypothetical protein